MLVREVMHPDPVTTTVTTSIKEALQVLARLGITAMPVVDRHGQLRGVVSEADLIQDVVPRDPRAHERPIMIDPVYPPTTVEDVYTRAAVAVSADDDMAVAVELMTTIGAKSLPVIDERHRVIGVVSRSDVVKKLARPDAQIAADLDALLAKLGHKDWLVEVDDGAVRVSGPADPESASLARVVAQTVPGVVDVHVTS